MIGPAPGLVVLDGVKEQANQISEQCYCMTSASAPTSGFLPQLPQYWTVTRKPNEKPFCPPG